MFESIGVQAERGIIKFSPIPEECLATNGMTMLGEIERLERQYADENSGLKRALTKSSKKSAVAKAKSSFQLSRKSGEAARAQVSITPPIPSPGPLDSGVAVNEEGKDSLGPLQADGGRFNGKSLKHSASKQLHPKASAGQLGAPDDIAGPKLGKRKSFIAIFRR
jgi:hypothetical protein